VEPRGTTMSLEGRLERIEKMLERILSILEGREAKPEGLKPEGLDALGWRAYPSGRGEWIFSDRAPAQLVKELEEKGGSCTLHGYRYRFRGPPDNPKKFIARVKL